MNIIPYEHFSINTSLSPAETVSVVSRAIKLKKTGWVAHDNGSEKFEGTVEETEFKINRVIGYANPSLPIIYGRYYVSAHGVQLDIKMTVRWSSKIFIIICCILLIYVFVASVANWANTGILNGGVLIAPAMMVFLYLVTMLGWLLEVEKARKFIKTLFQKHTVPPAHRE